jgi:hypothetical protein
MIVGGSFVLLFVVIGLGSLVLSIMTVVDASKYPEWAFQQTGSSKFVWQVIPIILIFACGVAGGVMGLIWYTSKRQEVARAAQAGGPPPYYGAPPGYLPPPQPQWGQPPPPPPPPSSPPSWTPPTPPPAAPPPTPPAEPPQ